MRGLALRRPLPQEPTQRRRSTLRRCAIPPMHTQLRRLRVVTGDRDSRGRGLDLRHSAASLSLVLRAGHLHGLRCRRPHLRAWPDPLNPPVENVPLENLLGLFLNIQYLIEDAIGYIEFI